jgi:hypothetical protein
MGSAIGRDSGSILVRRIASTGVRRKVTKGQSNSRKKCGRFSRPELRNNNEMKWLAVSLKR